MGIGARDLGNRGCDERLEPSLEESKELRREGHFQSGDPTAVVVAVARGVLVKVGVEVAVPGAVAVGDTNVTALSVVVAGIGELTVSLSDALSASGELPSATVAKRTVARTPSPLGPPKPPVEEQPNVKLFAVVVGGRQAIVRAVEPRNGPFVTLVNDSTVESHVSVRT